MASELTPLPGDPVALKAKAGELSSSAQQIQEAINQLRKLADRNDTVSEAVDKVRGKSVDVANNITKAHVRYVGTAEALQEYAPKLEAAQQRANRAIQAHGAAQQQVTNAQASLQKQSDQYTQDQANKPASATAGAQPPQSFGDTPAGNLANQAVSDANDAVSSAIKEYNEAKAEVETAAQHAISKINSAIDDSGLNDSFWDRLKNTVESWASDAYNWAKKNLAPILDVIQKVAAALNNILSWVSMVVSILAVFIPVLAPIAAALDVITLALAAISFLATFGLALMGDRTWGDVLSEGINVVMSAMPIKGAGKELGESAEKIGQQGMKRFAGKLSSKMMDFGDKSYMKGLTALDEKMGDKLGTLSDMVGEKGRALGLALNGGKISEAATKEGSRIFLRASDAGLSEPAASRLMHFAANRTERTMTTKIGDEWAEHSKKLADIGIDYVKDTVKDNVVGNGTTSLDHYVLHQEDHNPSGWKIAAPGTAIAYKPEQEDGKISWSLEPGLGNPSQGWALHHGSGGAETADLAGAGG